MRVAAFSHAVKRAVAGGLEAAAILDTEGKPLAVAGALDDDEARAVAAVVTHRLRTVDLLSRMLEGEMVTSLLDDREVSIGIASRCVFLVVILGRDPATSRALVDDFRYDVERAISEVRADFSGSRPPVDPGSGGSSSGPAELPLIELGVTVRRDRN